MKKFTDKINESVEEKIPTASEWLESFGADADDMYYKQSVEEAMIEFAKLHVEACKKEISENVRVTDSVGEFLQRDELGFEGDNYIDKNSILNSYPLENIK